MPLEFVDVEATAKKLEVDLDDCVGAVRMIRQVFEYEAKSSGQLMLMGVLVQKLAERHLSADEQRQVRMLAEHIQSSVMGAEPT